MLRHMENVEMLTLVQSVSRAGSSVPGFAELFFLLLNKTPSVNAKVLLGKLKVVYLR